MEVVYNINLYLILRYKSMFVVMFDDNAMVCDSKEEALELVNSLTEDGYKYITVSHNQPLDIEDMQEIEL